MKKSIAIIFLVLFGLLFTACSKEEPKADGPQVESRLAGAWVFATDSSCSTLLANSGIYLGFQFEASNIYMVGSFTNSIDANDYEKELYGNIYEVGTGYVNFNSADDGLQYQISYYFLNDTCLSLTSGSGGYMKKLTGTVRSTTRSQNSIRIPFSFDLVNKQ